MAGVKVLKIYRDGAELASVPLVRPGLLIGRSPNCDGIIRRKNIAPVQFLVEWIGFGEFDANDGEWAIVNLGLDSSAGAAMKGGTGVGQIVEDGHSLLLDGFEFKIAKDRLQGSQLDALITRSLDVDKAGNAEAKSRVLELIFLNKVHGTLEDVAHVDFTRNRNHHLSQQIGGLNVVGSTDGEVQLSFNPAHRELEFTKNNSLKEKFHGAEFKYSLKNLDFVKIETKEIEVFARLTKRLDSPVSRPSLFDDALFKSAVISLIIGIILLNIVNNLNVDEKPIEKIAPRIAKIEVRSDKAVTPAQKSEPQQEIPEQKQEIKKTDGNALSKSAKSKLPSQNSEALSEKKVSGQNRVGLNNQARSADVNSVGLLGAIKSNSKNKVRADMVVNNGVVSNSIVGKDQAVNLPQSPSGVISDTTKIANSDIGGAGTTLKVKDKGGGGQLGLTGGGSVSKATAGLGGDLGLGSGKRDGLKIDSDEVVDGGLDRESIRRALAGYKKEVITCYERSLLTKTAISGRVSYKWYINPDGKAAWVQIIKSDTQAPQLDACVRDIIQQIKFPKAPRGTTVIYPFEFQAKGK